MKFLRKNIKIISAFVLGLIISGGIVIYATSIYNATDIAYSENKNVAQALNELYDVSQLEARIEELENKFSDTTIYKGTVKNNYAAAQTTTVLNQFTCPKSGKIIAYTNTKTSSTTAVTGTAFYYNLSIANKKVFGSQTYYWNNNWKNNAANISGVIEVNKNDTIQLTLWALGATTHDVNELYVKYIEVY